MFFVSTWTVNKDVYINFCEPIEMPFGTCTQVGPRNHVLGGQDPLPAEGAIQVAKDSTNTTLERKVRDGWHQARQNSATDPRPQAFSPGEGVSAFGE